MKVIFRPLPANGWNQESLVICGGDDFESPVVRLHLTHVGYKKISDSRMVEIVTSILTSMEGIEFDLPGELEEYIGGKREAWLDTGNETRVRVPRGGGTSGEIKIPHGAKFLPTGEIDVPARSLDGSHPDAKKFRRACRSARNAIRELATSSGKTVELIMLELKEKNS